PSGDRGDKRHAHWQQVAIAACEQCGRNRIPAIHVTQALSSWLAAAPDDSIALVPDGEHDLATLSPPTAAMALLVGPEGGWDAAELTALRASKITTVRLGPRILRTETAGVAALAAMQLLWGDY